VGIELIIAFLLLGIVVGVLAGLLGIGGGGILVPILTSIFLYQGVPKDSVLHLALGTSMACIILTSFSSMRSHHKNGGVNFLLVKPMALGMVFGTFFATFLTIYLSAKVLAVIFTIFMAYVAIQMYKKKKVSKGVKKLTKTELGLVSLGIGGISALVSIGGGSLTVPYLTWRGIDIRTAIGSSSVLGFCISVAGTFGYIINGIFSQSATNDIWSYIYLPALLLVSIPSYFTAPLGAKLTHRLPIETLKKIFAVLLMLLSLKMALTFI
jgi:uncharacterized protein